MSFSTVSRSSVLKSQDSTTWDGASNGGLVPLQAPSLQERSENRRSRPASGTETAGKLRKAEVSSRFRHRDCTEGPKTGGLVPIPAPRQQGSTENRRSRPSSGTETARKYRKTAVSSRSRHRDNTEESKTEGLVPPQAPRLHGSTGNRWSRPASGTETTRKARKPEVSSRFRHRDYTEASESGVLVTLQAPRPHGSIENWRSRPSSDTETIRKSRKPEVLSRLRHRDCTEASKTGGLVPLLAPRPHGSIGNWRSRPSSGTETTRKHRKLEVSSHLRHRDRREAPKTGGLVPLQAPRPRGSFENRRSRPASGTETARGQIRKIVLYLYLI